MERRKVFEKVYKEKAKVLGGFRKRYPGLDAGVIEEIYHTVFAEILENQEYKGTVKAMKKLVQTSTGNRIKDFFKKKKAQRIEVEPASRAEPIPFEGIDTLRAAAHFAVRLREKPHLGPYFIYLAGYSSENAPQWTVDAISKKFNVSKSTASRRMNALLEFLKKWPELQTDLIQALRPWYEWLNSRKPHRANDGAPPAGAEE